MMMETVAVEEPAAPAGLQLQQTAGAAWGQQQSGSSSSNGAALNGAGQAASSGGGGGSSSSSGGGAGAGAWRRRPTWRIVPGVSTESLALEVANRCRLPPRVVARAAQLYEQLMPMAPRPPAPSEAAADTVAPAVEQPAAGASPARRPLRGRAARTAAVAVPAAGGAAGGTAAAAAAAAAAGSNSAWTLAAAADALQQVAQDALANCKLAEASPQQAQQDQVQVGSTAAAAAAAAGLARRGCSPLQVPPRSHLLWPANTAASLAGHHLPSQAGRAVCAAQAGARPRHRGLLLRLCAAPPRWLLLCWLH